MPDYAWTDGVAPSAATINANVREQVVTTCTSATRPTNVEGHLIYETNTDRVLLGTGSGSNWVCLAEPIQTWTPSVSGLTTGNGTWVAYSWRANGIEYCIGRFTFGSTSAVTGALVVTLPSTALSSSVVEITGQFTDLSASAEYPLSGRLVTTTTAVIGPTLTSGTYGSRSTTSATVPFTWATGDDILFTMWYPMANRYD